MIFDIIFFILGCVAGYVVSSLQMTMGMMKIVMSPKLDEMTRLPYMPQRRKPPAFVPNWNQEKKEEGAVVMPDRADVIKRDDLKIDDLLQ